MPIIPGLRKLRYEGLKFEANLDDLARPCLEMKILKGLGL